MNNFFTTNNNPVERYNTSLSEEKNHNLNQNFNLKKINFGIGMGGVNSLNHKYLRSSK